MGFDCSGLALYAVYQATGIILPHGAGMESQPGGQVISNQSDLQPGDLVFFGGGSLSNFEHVGIYAGNGMMWDANDYNVPVQEHSLAWEEAALAFDGGVRYWSTSGGSDSWRAAFPAAGTNNLYLFDSTSGTIPTTLGIANGTGPAIAAPNAGYEEAFQASGTGHLYLNGAVTNGDTQQGMASGTSPAIAAVSSSNNYEVAFQANTGNLFVYTHMSSGDSTTPTTWGLWPGTSPSIAVLSTGQYEIAFQAAGSGHLYVWGPDGIIDTGQGMMAGTSPSIAASPSGGYVVAFQVNIGQLYYFNSNHVTSPTNLGMDNGSSPAITAPPSGGYETAFEAAGTDHMYLNGNYTTGDTGQGMWPGTSPSITGLSGGYEAVFKAAGNGNLYLYNHTSSGDMVTPTTQGVASGTSPSVG